MATTSNDEGEYRRQKKRDFHGGIVPDRVKTYEYSCLHQSRRKLRTRVNDERTLVSKTPSSDDEEWNKSEKLKKPRGETTKKWDGISLTNKNLRQYDSGAALKAISAAELQVVSGVGKRRQDIRVLKRIGKALEWL